MGIPEDFCCPKANQPDFSTPVSTDARAPGSRRQIRRWKRRIGEEEKKQEKGEVKQEKGQGDRAGLRKEQEQEIRRTTRLRRSWN